MRILIFNDEQKFVNDLKFHIELYRQTHLISANITAVTSANVVNLPFVSKIGDNAFSVSLGESLIKPDKVCYTVSTRYYYEYWQS